MSQGSPARWLAPLALVAALVAVLVIVTGGSEDSGEQASPTTTEQRRGERATRTGEDGTTTSTTETSTTDAPPAETYVVRPGDTLASIAEETDTTVEELQELNPDVDSNSLTIGQEIKLAR